jgi:tetratricopeptide (TPR) repeat protein
MDGRKPLAWALALLVGTAGCRQTGLLRGPSARGPAEEMTHNPSTYVAFGDMRAEAGLAANTTPALRARYAEEARRSYEKALEVDPGHVPAHRALARLYEGTGDPARAVASYQRAVEADEQDASLWYDLGMCHSRLKDWDCAIDCLSQASQRDPENRQYANALGFVLARAGRYDDSLRCLARLNGEAKAHYDLARMLCHLNQTDEAREHLALAVRLDPQLGAARDLLAELRGGPRPDIQTVSYTEPAGGPAKPESPAPAPPPPPAPPPKPNYEDYPPPQIITPAAR